MLLLVLLTASAPLRVWHSFRGAEAAVLAEIAGDDAELDAIPFDVLQSKLEQAFLAGDPPDVFIAPHGRVREWARHLATVAPIGDVPAALASLTVDGRLVGAPFALKTLALVRNRSLLPDDVATLDALVAPSGGFALGFDTKTFYFFSPFFLAGNEALLNDGLQIRGAVQTQSLEWLRRQQGSRFLARGLDHTQLLSLFKANRVAGLVDGPWALAELDDLDAVAVQPLPPVRFAETLQRPRPFLTIDAVFVPRGPNEARALAFAERITLPRYCAERLQRALEIPPHQACFGALTDERARRLLQPFFAAVQAAQPIPTDPRMEVLWSPLDSMLASVAGSDRPIATLQAQAEREFARLNMADVASPFWIDAVAGLALVAFAASRLRRRSSPEPTSWTALGFLSPVLAFALPLLVAPMVLGIALALFAHHDGALEYVGLGNYTALLRHPAFYATLGVTVLWTAANLTVHTALGVALALALDRREVKLRGVFRALLILPWALPNYLSALVFHHLFNFELGAANQLLAALGVERVDWFGSFVTSFCANLTANAWLGFPFVMVVTLGALQNVDQSQREAMLLDGAGAQQRFWHLTVPAIVPVLGPALILSAVWTFNMFNIIYLVSGGEPRGETEILITEAYRWAFERGGRYGIAAAYCVVIFAILWAFLRLQRAVTKHA